MSIYGELAGKAVGGAAEAFSTLMRVILCFAILILCLIGLVIYLLVTR